MVGHEWAVALLSRRLATGRVAHAYLFCGPPQVGKTRLARILAQALNCPQPEPPCGQCPSCLKIEKQTHPDVRLISGEGAGDSFKIDQIRDLQREAAFFPYEGRHRVFILRRMDLATMEAANSLLKTLEEPPQHVVLILTALTAENLPSTVVSRCQRLDLRPIGRSRIEAALQARGLTPEKARLLARLSAGRIGWAIEASGDDAILSRRQRDLDHLIHLLSAGRVERLDVASKIARDPRVCRDLVELWAAWWRDLVLLSGKNEESLVNIDRATELQSLAQPSRLAEAWATLRTLQTVAAQLEANVNARLAMENMLLKLPHWRLRDRV